MSYKLGEGLLCPLVSVGLSHAWARGFALCLLRRVCGSSHGTLEGSGSYRGTLLTFGSAGLCVATLAVL